MRGDTTSRINLSTPSKTLLPDVSICFPILDILNTSLFQQTFPNTEFVDKFYSWTRKQKATIYSILGNLTLDELTTFMKNYHDIIVRVVPADLQEDDDDKSDNITCSDVNYIFEPNMCITVSCTRNHKAVYFDRRTIFAPQHSGHMLTIELNPNLDEYASSINIILTTPGRMVRTRSHPSYGLYSRQDNPFTLVLSYQTIVNKLLEKYETDCWDYSKLGFDDRNHFIESCYNNYSYKLLNSAFYGTVQMLNHSAGFMHPGYRQYYFEFLDQNYSRRLENEKVFENIRAICWEKAQHVDCLTEVYMPRLHRIIGAGRDEMNVIIHAPTVPAEINKFFPKYYLMDYLIYIGSSLNFWFGLSLVTLVDRIINRVALLLQRGKAEKLACKRKNEWIRCRRDTDLGINNNADGKKLTTLGETRNRKFRPRNTYGAASLTTDIFSHRIWTDFRRINDGQRNYVQY